MRGGFSFCGISESSLGLSYAPTGQDMYVFDLKNPNINDEVFEGHDGGYYFGYNITPKQLKLKCFFEEKNINLGLIERISEVFSIGRTGQLIFDSRPWCAYSATCVGIDLSGILNNKNGIINISFNIYYPFARGLIEKTIDNKKYEFIEENSSERLIENTGYLIGKPDKLSKTILTNGETITDSEKILLYNPGNAPCDVCIEIKGEMPEGIEIRNNTNGTYCRFNKIENNDFKSNNQYLVCDGLSGKTIITNGTDYSVNSYIKHNSGFLKLDPVKLIKRCDYTIFTNGDQEESDLRNHIYSSDKIFDILDEGKYIYINNNYYKIIKVINDKECVINEYIETEIEQIGSNILKLNEIEIVKLGIESFTINKLNFEYRATFY